MKISRLVLMALLSLGLSLFIPTSSKAIHKGAGDLVCGQCHTMHSSQGGTNGLSMGGPTGSFLLLRTSGSSIGSRAGIHKLCLQCHASNGTQAGIMHAPQNVKAPKVYSPPPLWTQNNSFGTIGAGGNFYSEVDSTNWDALTPTALGYGHSLGAPSSVTPPGGDQPISGDGFSCTNCHDPHGTSNELDANVNIFRNLRVNAIGAGAKSGVKFPPNSFYPSPAEYHKHKSYVGGVNPSGTSGYFGGSETDNAGQVIWPVYRGTLAGTPAGDSQNSNAYATGDDGDNDDAPTSTATMSKWCRQCHDDWHVASGDSIYKVSGSLGWDWKRHPTNVMVPRKSVANCASGCHISMLDRSNYNSTVITEGRGLPVTTSSYYADNVYYLPYESPGTCGDSPDISCMDTPVNDGNHKVFCLSCHFAHGGPYYDNLRWDYTSAVSSGSQSGNGVPSNVGCQLCHNR